MSLPFCTIKHSPTASGGGGFIVRGKILPNGFWHPTAKESVTYCRSVLRYGVGTTVEVYDKDGKLFKTITIAGNGGLASDAMCLQG